MSRVELLETSEGSWTVMVDGEARQSYRVDGEGRKIEPLTQAQYLKARGQIARAAGELFDRFMDGESVTPWEQAAMVELTKIQTEMALRDL